MNRLGGFLLLHSILLGASPVIAVPDEPRTKAIGAYYFATSKLSRDGELSCASCHEPSNAWQDGYERALARRLVLSRNTPTILNVGRHRMFFWDGRASSLEAQVEGPLFAIVELSSSDDILEAVTRDCASAHDAWVRSGIPVRDFVARSLAAYMRAVAAGRTRFEDYLAGRASLTEKEQRGYQVFSRELGCTSCHPAPSLTDDQFHDIGLPRRRLILQTTANPKVYGRLSLGVDHGRINISNRADDVYKFRTPSLYMVSRTGPYMHDGAFRSLSEVLDFYSRRRIDGGSSAISEEQRGALLALFEAFSDLRPAAVPNPVCDPKTPIVNASGGQK